MNIRKMINSICKDEFELKKFKIFYLVKEIMWWFIVWKLKDIILNLL